MTTYHFTEQQLRKMLGECISMYVDYRKRYDWTPDKVVQEVVEGLDASKELVEHGQLERVKAGLIVLPKKVQETIQSWCVMNGLEA